MMKKMRRKIAVAVTVAFLAFPLSATQVLADTVTSSSTTAPTTTTADTTTPTTTPDTTVPVTTAPATTSDTTVPATTTPATTPDPSATVTTTPVDSNGNAVTPDNWFTDLIEKLQLALTFDPARKAELIEHHALAKLAKAQKLMKEGNSEAAQLYLNEYTDKITQAQDFLNQVKDPTSDTAKNLEIALSKVNTNNIQVLSSLVEKLPPQAAQKLALNVVHSMEKAITKMENEDSKVVPTKTVTTPPAITVGPTSLMDAKTLDKQAKIALKDFRKALTVPMVTRSEQGKEDMHKQEDNGKDKVRGKKGNHRD